MLSTISQSAMPRNSILSALPFSEYQTIAPKLKPVKMPVGETLYEVGDPINHVYFPETSIIATINVFEDGSSLETGITGHEGMTGVGLALASDYSPRETSVQKAGEGFQMAADDFRLAFESNNTFQHVILRFVFAYFEQVAQSGACINNHPVSKRLARWLLMCHDRTDGNDLQITQDFMAQMLGVNRPSVTVAAIQLKDEGLIKYSRGLVTIRDREGLEHASCECYDSIKRIYDQYLSVVELRQMNRKLEQLNQKMDREFVKRREIQKTTMERVANLRNAVSDITAVKTPPMRVRVCRNCQRFCDFRNNPASPNEMMGRRMTAEFLPITCTECQKF
jgi:CRP-like cAMP-binding protein